MGKTYNSMQMMPFCQIVSSVYGTIAPKGWSGLIALTPIRDPVESKAV